MSRYSTAIVGAGPAGIGLLVCAAQRGRLGPLLDEGVAIVERSETTGAGALGRYRLNSDSLASSFVECLEPEPSAEVLGPLTRDPVALELIRDRESHVPLSRVAEFLGRVGQTIRDEVAKHPRCDWLPRTEARSLKLTPDGRIEIEIAGAERTGTTTRISARRVVLALGGAQDLDDVLGDDVSGFEFRRIAGRIVLTDDLLSEGGLDRATARLGPTGRRIVIVGGSHSAFSAAWTLAGTNDTARGPFDVLILHRDRLRIFYSTPDEARLDGYGDFSDDDICPVTGRVHRLGGLRGDGRTLWRQATGRAAPQVPGLRIEPIEDSPEGRGRTALRLERADLVVPAFGYRPRTLPIHDSTGRRLLLRADTGGSLVGHDARVALADGSLLRRVLGIGLASGFLPPGERSFRAQTNGVWLYHNVFGEAVLRGIESDAAA